MKKFTLVLFFSIAFYCGKAQEIFVGESKNVIEAYFIGKEIKLEKGYDKATYILNVFDNDTDCTLYLYINRNSRKCIMLNIHFPDYQKEIKRLNRKLGIPVSGYWITENKFGKNVKITLDKNFPESFWYEYL